MVRNKNAIAHIINGQWSNVIANCNTYQLRMLHAVRSCRTSALGGQLYQCNSCCRHHIRYNSCRNRHCPQCQNTQKERWILARQAQLIDTTYYHVVFTIPHVLNSLCKSNQRIMYACLLRSTWDTLNTFGWNKKYLGAQIGATTVLHTWGSNLSYHPHVHCMVPGGGVTLKNKWKQVKGNGKYLFNAKAMSIVFRAKYIAAITKAGILIPQKLKHDLYKKPWVVYAKPSYGNRETLIKYLARYAYKTAITHHRIISYSERSVSFKYKDYRHKNLIKIMTLSSWEFVRRFTQHILPKGFCRIRHYGILNGSWKSKIFTNASVKKKDWKEIWEDKGLEINKCPHCKKGILILKEEIQPKRGPPCK